jgi:hypothetical protein
MREVNWKPRDRDSLERECEMRADDTMKLCKEIDALNAELVELRALVKDRLDWYTRSGRTKTLLSGVWITRARKALGLTGPGDLNG